jgi:hypothetical protein
MGIIEQTTPVFWAATILGAATVFTIFWSLDAMTHKDLVHEDISKQELQTHRNILASSVLMELSLVLMFWFQKAMLPFFIAFAVTRTVHEFIDELKYHADRCTPYENYLHLFMWISVITKTSAMFIWGYFAGFEGVLDLPIIFYIWALIVFGVMGYVSLVEWRR